MKAAVMSGKPAAFDAMPPISREIWDAKYRLKKADGTPVDVTVEDMWRRVAKALAAPEANPAKWEKAFYEAMEGFKFLPAGRIVAGAGTDRHVTLSNCFVLRTIPDDMGGIFDALKEAALTMQAGGGIGMDFSTLRPKGAPVLGVGADASGPLSFMDVWDAMCRTIMSAGSRRGAMMATMRCDHPDIEDFIGAKRDAKRLRMFNLSVLVTDAFMAAVAAGADWPLVFKGKTYRIIKATALWGLIMRSTYDFADPGVIFIDRVNQQNNLYYCEEISASNPCGEQMLPPWGACLLGSINLAALIRAPYTDSADLDMEALYALAPVAIRMMDNVIAVSRYAVPEQREEALAKRRLGLGVTGLADALLMCGVRYGDNDSVALARCWATAIQNASYRASVELAREKGSFPLFDREKYPAGKYIRTLDRDLRDGIAEFGIRNSHLTSIAPTGTISLVAHNVSSGIEPIFAPSYVRKVLQPDGTRVEHEVVDYAVSLWRKLKGPDAGMPPNFVSAHDVSPSGHLSMQSAFQHFIDSSISKTINLPEAIAFEDFEEVYLLAYKSGCKGCTTYRPNETTGSVLTVTETKSTPQGNAPALSEGAEIREATIIARPKELPGKTYKLKWPESAHAIYITVNDVEENGVQRPFEVFINSKNMDHYAWTVALTRMISGVFRRGGDVAFVFEELQAVFDPVGGAWMDGRFVPSLLAAIGDIIERHMVSIGFVPPRLQETEQAAVSVDASPEVATRSAPRLPTCPKCGRPALIKQEGCDSCTECDYAKCG